MNPPDITSGQFVSFILLGFGLMAVYPFAKAFLMYFAIRMVKFQSHSYWKAFFCVLIGIGTTMAIQMILLGITLQPGREFDPNTFAASNLNAMFLGLFLVPIAEAISLLLFFKESLGKTLGAIVLTYMLAIALAVVLSLLFVALMFLITLASG